MPGFRHGMDTTTRALILAAAALLPALPAAAQTDPNLIWKGDFEDGSSSLTGHCSAGQNQWCDLQTIRPQQIQVVTDPAAQGK